MRVGDRGEDGLAAVEFAIVAPLLLLMMFGAVTFGHAAYVRYLLAAETYSAARACAVTEADATTCEAYAFEKLQASIGTSSCNFDPFPEARKVSLTQGAGQVLAVRLDVSCKYVGLVGTEYLGKSGISIGDLKISAVVPY